MSLDWRYIYRGTLKDFKAAISFSQLIHSTLKSEGSRLSQSRPRDHVHCNSTLAQMTYGLAQPSGSYTPASLLRMPHFVQCTGARSICANAKPKVSDLGSHLTPNARPDGRSPISRAMLGMAQSASGTVTSTSGDEEIHSRIGNPPWAIRSVTSSRRTAASLSLSQEV